MGEVMDANYWKTRHELITAKLRRSADRNLELAIENADLREQLDEAERLIRKAKDAARKLNTMYLRHEVSPRSELDGLISVKERLTSWIYRRRGMTYEPESAEA